MKVNGQSADGTLTPDGYYTISRKWKKSDKVELHLDMEPRTVKAHAKVEVDKGRIAVERGPIVYCAEWPDNDFDVLSIFVNQKPQFTVTENPELLEGIVELTTDGQTLAYDDKGRLTVKDVKLNMIPYYAWCHRGSGNMAVWLPQELSASRPVMPPTIASQSKITTSSPMGSLSSLNDRLVPKDENDRSVPYTHWWPKQGTTEWISYELPEAQKVQSATVYWFDDGPWGGCRVPKSWNLYYQDASGQWQPVTGAESFGTQKGAANTVDFDPVTTKALKLDMALSHNRADAGRRKSGMAGRDRI